MDETKIPPFRPQTPEQWESCRPLFTRLYWEQDMTLPQVMVILERDHGIKASTKMWKNKISLWKLSKYLKANEAEKLLDGSVAADDVAHIPALTKKPEKILKKRAARSVKRRQARAALSREASSATPMDLRDDDDDDVEMEIAPSPDTTIVPYTPVPSDSLIGPYTPAPYHLQINGVAEEFLFNLRDWTNAAFLLGHWNKTATTELAREHNRGRLAARLLSSDLTAGTKLYEKGKPKQAFTYWNKAVAGLQAPDLFESWYHETPIRLIFEISRVVLHEQVNGREGFAATLLRSIGAWASNHLKEDDSRRALFSLFGKLEPLQLRELYTRAARCLHDGLETWLDKDSPLLYEVRLNRALDLLWYNADSDISEWLPPIEQIDRAFGANNSYSIYFLLLQAYREIGQDAFAEAEQSCAEVNARMSDIGEGRIDSWRLAMAYRRLGRQYYLKARYPDAQRSFNTALKYVGNASSGLSASILIEIGHSQEQMAKTLGDQVGAEVWGRVLQQLERQAENVEREVHQMPPSQWLRLPKVVNLLTNKSFSQSRSATCIF